MVWLKKRGAGGGTWWVIEKQNKKTKKKRKKKWIGTRFYLEFFSSPFFEVKIKRGTGGKGRREGGKEGKEKSRD